MGNNKFNENTRVQVPAALHLCKLGYTCLLYTSLCRSKEVQQGNGRRSDVAYHDTRYQQHDIALYQRGKEKDKCHNQHGSDKCAKQYGEEAGQDVYKRQECPLQTWIPSR